MWRLIVLLAVAITGVCFRCETYCDPVEVVIIATDKTVTHLDNRGAIPVVLHSGDQGWHEAYGFRLSAISELQNPADTVGVECPYYYFKPTIATLTIVTLTGMGPQYPPGTDVSKLFKFVRQESSQYVDVAESQYYLSSKWSQPGSNFSDFLLVKPPVTPGWQQFGIQFQQSDSTSFSIVTDSIYLQ